LRLHRSEQLYTHTKHFSVAGCREVSDGRWRLAEWKLATCQAWSHAIICVIHQNISCVKKSTLVARIEIQYWTTDCQYFEINVPSYVGNIRS
jgi:hypothetical protein